MNRIKMGKRDKNGRALERLVAVIEAATADKQNVRVESPKFLPDRVTGETREDVVLTVKQHHHTLIIAIECRDRSRPVGVPDVEGFNQKCRDTGVGLGIIVSAKGFAETARRKDKHLGIVCLDMEGVASFDWMGTTHFHQASRYLISASWRFEPERSGDVDEASGVDYLDHNGNELTDDSLE